MNRNEHFEMALLLRLVTSIILNKFQQQLFTFSLPFHDIEKPKLVNWTPDLV